MPLPYLSKLASKHGVSLNKAEDRWSKAKSIAAKAGRGGDYAYITGIAKKMFGESYPGISKMIRDLVEDIKSGRIDADEAASILAETFTSGSAGGFIAGGLLPRGNPWDREGQEKSGGAHKNAFPVGTRDRNGVPREPGWGSEAEQKSAKNLPGRKHHHKHKKQHHK